MDLTSTPEWRRLLALGKPPTLRELFATDPDRARRYRFTCADLTVDLSKNWLTDDILRALVDVADASALSKRRTAMFAGEHINSTEDRAVLHVALRLPRASSLIVDGHDVVPDIHRVLDRMSAFADAVRDATHLGHTGKPIEAVVNIGIGGSDLGPAMAYDALHRFADGPRCRFVSNVDGADIAGALADLNPETTLFVVCSKTFTTIETLTNATTARDWLVSAIGDERAVANHFVAVSTNAAAVSAFGIDPQNMFGFWDWVGGRYSIDSAVGLSVMLAIGPARFGQFLSGFHSVDKDFVSVPHAQNVAVIMALLGMWYSNVHGAQTKAVLPYSHNLRRFPAYLQQLDMESNGKAVGLDGRPVATTTGPVVWGEPGTNGQHAFYQLLHQGSWLIPCDFIGFARLGAGPQHHHDLLMSNLFAQAEALAFGRTRAEVAAEGVPEHQIDHRVFPGNRPSTMILADELSPKVLGELIALYEHIVFVQGAIWGINPFDQWGVELGKALANRITAELVDASAVPAHDPSTNALIAWYRARRPAGSRPGSGTVRGSGSVAAPGDPLGQLVGDRDGPGGGVDET